MPAGNAFSRHCPQCGRRFEIRVVKKEVEEDDSEDMTAPQANSGLIVPLSPGPTVDEVIELGEGEPVLVEEKRVNYTYRCHHCGHQWTEVRMETEMEHRPEGYSGD